MAPLSPDNTARYRVHYTVIGAQHTMEIRSLISPGALGTLVDSLLTQLGTDIFAMVVDFVEFAASGSNVFNSVTTGIEGFTYGSGAGTTIQIPNYVHFIGRTTGGRRVRLTVFGIIGLGTDYRFIAGEDALIDAAISVLVASGGNILGIDGLTPVWKSYANAGTNAHWQKAVRP
jgi:hypothetical protein